MQAASTAPEVAYSTQPEKRRSHEGEGLQHAVGSGSDEQLKSANAFNRGANSTRPSRSPIWTIALCIVSAIVALGAGIGIGYAVGHDSNGSNSSKSTVTVTTTSTIQPPSATSVISDTSVNVNRGIVGIAPYSCDNGTTYSSPYGVKFGQDCHEDYTGGSTRFGYSNSSNEIVSDIIAVLTYSFEECMDVCAQYNSNSRLLSSFTPCGAVTYNANLTWTLEHGSGANAVSCYIKDYRGIGQQETGEDDNYGLVASAYMID